MNAASAQAAAIATSGGRMAADASACILVKSAAMIAPGVCRSSKSGTIPASVRSIAGPVRKMASASTACTTVDGRRMARARCGCGDDEDGGAKRRKRRHGRERRPQKHHERRKDSESERIGSSHPLQRRDVHAEPLENEEERPQARGRQYGRQNDEYTRRHQTGHRRHGRRASRVKVEQAHLRA